MTKQFTKLRRSSMRLSALEVGKSSGLSLSGFTIGDRPTAAVQIMCTRNLTGIRRRSSLRRCYDRYRLHP
ncbi:MAG: hypothetical protein ACLR8P_06910 [Clostridium fessum]